MNPWLETIGVVLVAVLGILLGRMFSRFRKSHWALGYIIPTLLTAMLLMARFADSLPFAQPFFWIVAGRAKFVVLCLAVTTGLTTPMSRLPRKFERLVVCIVMTVVVIWFSVLPFLVPALIKERLSNLETTVCTNGVCYQSTDYTCGPAAAVTALRKLGLPADEGELAILSHSSPVAGTLPPCLYAALQDRYGPDGLKCEFRRFDSLAELRDAGLALVVVRDGFLSDHCVAVLEVSDHMVVVGDPVTGRNLMSHEQFEKIWRFSGIVLQRKTARNI
ncbi:MAG: cysteine peptidase family C39 domain-containing protein [Planctomycetota bacterium]